jgi:hypothetical protein
MGLFHSPRRLDGHETTSQQRDAKEQVRPAEVGVRQRHAYRARCQNVDAYDIPTRWFLESPHLPSTHTQDRTQQTARHLTKQAECSHQLPQQGLQQQLSSRYGR